MTGKMLLLSALLVGAVTMVHSRLVVDSPASAMTYLYYYGYMALDCSVDTDESDFREAICKFQDMASLPLTCELNAATMEKMNLPRCGMPDILSHNLDAKRKKRYSIGTKWSRTNLTYRIDNRTPDIPNPDDVDSTLAAALKVWSDVTPLTFSRVTGNTAADILITFNSGTHNDGNTFDGPSGVLAHAYYPENGDVHFDEDEQWTINTDAGINLFQVAVHEFGHTLGLGHSNIKEAVMTPFYREYVPNFQLHSDDISGIRAHYVTSSTGGCTGKVDAVIVIDGITYIFEGSDVWKVKAGKYEVAAGFPKSIASVFVGLPNDIDAALYYPNEKTYIFKGSQYWQFTTGVTMDDNYPLNIGRNWQGVPDDLDAAFVWGRDNTPYFIKGDLYYRYSRANDAVEPGYPKPLSLWNIPGNQVSAAVQWTNSRTYFLTSCGTYYRYNDDQSRVDADHPKDTATEWQICTIT